MSWLQRKMKAFLPVDIIVMSFLTGLTILILVLHQKVPSPGIYVVKHAVMIGLYLFFIELYNRNRTQWTAIPRFFYPVLLVPVLYAGFRPLINILVPHELDTFFLNIDKALFGIQPCLWIEQFINPWLTELFQVSYTSYYYFPTFLGVYFYIKKDHKAFNDLVLAVCLTMYGSFVGFVLVPVFGPRFFMADQFTVPLEGKFFAHLVAEFIDKNSIQGGAFPSGHSAVALVTIVYAYKYLRNYFYVALPVMICLFISTIYGRYHYVIDVLAGILLGLLGCYIAPKLNGWWSAKFHKK